MTSIDVLLLPAWAGVIVSKKATGMSTARQAREYVSMETSPPSRLRHVAIDELSLFSIFNDL
ncbi:MAG: hypothetical protein U5M50_12555 [Sphingobium sp.]|nr:hypothetical protein [Sphingobium sp.]